jgi:hypothetical protein
MAVVLFPDESGKGRWAYHLICAFCGDENIEPANGAGYPTASETVVFCNCCGKSGHPKFIDYSMSEQKELN